MAGSPYKSAPAVFITIFFIISTASSAPVDEEDSTALSNPQDSHISEYYGENNSTSCYYNYQQYQEGDRIITQEPCLNCTCQNRMLMCYLRVCPYTKDVGQDCTVEKRSDQCCPVITCPQVPVQLQLQASSTTLAPTTTAIAHPNSFGCEFNGAFFPDGAQVPPDPKNPCELCYCIRNRTACVLQECTLNVDGCRPVYQKGVCCPVRYDCDYERLATTTEPSNGLIITTTAETPLQCYYQKKMYDDGELITPERSTMSSCERCYCMRGEIVCAVQNCGNPMEGKDCEPVPPPEGQCCPTNYICANETIPIDESDASKIHSDSMVTDVNNLLDKNADKMVESTTAVQSEVTTESSDPQPITASNSPQEYDHVDSEQASSQVEPESEVIDLSVIPAEVTTEAQTEKIATEIMESTSIITNESDKEKGESLPDVTEPESVTSNTVHSEHDTVEMTTVISHSNGPHSVEIDEPEQSSEETMEKYDKDNATPISHVQGSEKITEQPSHPTDSSAGSEEHNTENSMKPEGGESDPVEQEEDSVVPEQETHKETEHSESSVESDEKEESEPEVSSVTTNAPIEISKMPEVGTSQTESDLRATEEPVKESEVTESSSTEKVEAPGKPETDEPAISNSIPHDPTVEHDSVEHDDDIEEPEIHPEVIHQDEEDSKSPQVTESPSSQNADETSPTTVQPTHVENESEPPKEEVSSDMVEENEQLSTSDDKNNIPLEQEAPTVGATSDDVTHPSPAETSEHIPDSQTVGTSIHEEKTDKPTEENEINNTNEQTQKPPQENENENDNAGDATTVQTGMEKGTIPGEGSCLVDGVTYLDGAEIPTSSPCHTECRCYSSIIKCKLMECPPPPSYLTNCIPVPQGEDSCCPVYSCDDKKKYPSLESQSQIGEMTTEHDDQIVENNQSTEANNEVPLPTTEGGAGVAQENTNSAPDENQKPISSVTSAPEEIPAQESVVTEQEEPINKPGVFPPLVSQSAENDGVDTEGFISGTTESSGEHPEEVQPSAQEEVKLENNEAQINEQTVTESGSPVVDQGTVKPESEIETSPNQEQGNENSSDATTLVYDHTQQTTVKTDTVPHDAAIESDLPTSHDSEEPVEHDDIQPVSQDSEEPSDHQESNKPEGTSPPEHQGNSDASTSESTNAPLVEETTSKHEEYEMPEVTTLEPDDHDSVPQESMSTVGVLTEHEPSQTESSDAVKNEVTESSSSHPEGIEVTTEPIKEMSVEYVQTTISSHINHEIVDKNKDEMQSLTNAEQQTTEQQIHDEMQPNIPAILTSIMDNVEKDGVSHYEEHDQEHVANEDQTTAPEIEHPENEKIDQIGTTTETIQQHNDDNVEEEHPVQPTTIRSDLQDPTTIRSDLQDPTTILSSEPDSEPQQPETVHIETPQPAIDETSEAEISTDPPKPEHDEEDEVKLTEVETETAHEVESSSEVSQVDQVVTEQQTTAPAEESSPEAVHINVDEIKSEIETTTRIEVEGGEHEEAVVHQTTESEAEQNLHDLMHNMINPPTTHTPTEDVADKDEHTEVVETSHENQDDDDLKKDTTTEVLQQEVVVNEYETPSSIAGELPVISSGEEGIKQQENSPDLIHDKEQESNTTPKEEIPEIKPEHEPEMSTESPHVETTTAKLSSMVHHPESEVYTSSVDHFPHLPMNQWTQKPFQPEVTSESPHTPEEGSFHPPSAAGETDYEEEEESVYEPGACRFGGKIFISAQQVPRENPCDFCFCFRSDIICLQQSCPPPILGCREESIHGFCCPRYECPVSMATTFNFTTTTTTTTTTLPPHFLAHNYRGAARRGGCQVQNKFYRVGDEIPTASGPCLQCICGANGQMKCDPKVCSPEPMIRKMIEEAERR